jgi:hypothetical protein
MSKYTEKYYFFSSIVSVTVLVLMNQRELVLKVLLDPYSQSSQKFDLTNLTLYVDSFAPVLNIKAPGELSNVPEISI